jgi:hypothetical protein
MRPSLFTLADVGLDGACSTYGADERETAPSDGGASSSSGGHSSSGGSSSGSGTTDRSVPDATDDGPTYNEVCPPCAGTCIPSGCSGAGPNNACNKPYDVTAAMSLVVFARPEGPTALLPVSSACGGGGPKHGALLRLGAATTDWTVKAGGTNPFAVGGDCNVITSGPRNSSTVDRSFAPFITTFRRHELERHQSCVPLGVELSPN